MHDPRLARWARYAAIPPRVNLACEVLERPLRAGRGKHVALISDSVRMTYDELAGRVEAFAAAIAARGISRGERVLIRAWNCHEFAIGFLGLVRIGAIPVTQNTAAGLADVAHVLEHSDAVAAIVLDELAEPVRALQAGRLGKGLIVARARAVRPGEMRFEDMTAGGAVAAAADTGADEPAFMCYTSGTTGRPKGILHAHRWVVARGEANRERVPPRDDDVVMAAGEWSFISLLGHNVLFALRNGVTAAVLEGRPSPERFLETIERFRVTVAHAVPTIYRRILAGEAGGLEYDTSSLRGCNASGEALGAATLDAWQARFGVDIWEHYGISEMQLAISQGPEIALKPGSIGVPWGAVVEIVDDDGRELPDGETGELVIRGDNPSFFLGYHKDPDKTAEVMRGGWFHTSDLARRDEDGYLWMAGRNDDCFKSRGLFIVPIEIENALAEHPAVAEACIVPVPDERDGNLIRAVVALKPQQAGDSADWPGELARYLAGRIARNKVPHLFELVDALPKSPIGKVLRRELMAARRSRTGVDGGGERGGKE